MKPKFYTKQGDTIKNHKLTTVWPRIKAAAKILRPRIGWIIGNGSKIDFWRDTWATDIPLREYIDLPQQLWKNEKLGLVTLLIIRAGMSPDIYIPNATGLGD
ncbi:hypothetical protein GIB67_001244 [Kingdonia uniflora]|uniref:Uncharacterized protein n=1 Tax=Kingdonia uniflora TaxID=39325 RepID=A0A7J7PAV1_9MAGN|nr:hypothetical protein GIB67_001244 [Kingdonia uniflora]